MKKYKTINFILFIFTALFAATVILVTSLSFKNPPAAKETDGAIGSDGNPVSMICVSDLTKLCTLTKVNYTPDQFLKPQHDFLGKIVESRSQETFAQRGTYMFLFSNLNPYDQNFYEKSEELAPYLKGDNHWHFTLYLPPCFSSCNVYVMSVLNAHSGEISDYNSIDYSDYQKKSEFHSDGTEPLFIDLRFYTRRQAIGEKPLDRTIAVTVHYEAAEGKTTGFIGAPLIGPDEAVRAAISRNNTMIWILAIFTALALAIFVFLCFLKRSISFIPQVFITAGLFLFFLSHIILTGGTALPYFWTSLLKATIQLIAASAACTVSLKIKKCPLRIPLAVFAVLNGFAAFYGLQFVASAKIMTVVLKISNISLAIALFAFAAINAYKSPERRIYSVLPILVSALLFASCLPKQNILIIGSPVLWLCATILIVTVLSGFGYFITLERQNIYLTHNLQSEVTRKTSDLKSIITEREELLRYLSHDMKKPVRSIERFLAALKSRESDPEQIKTIGIIEQKASDLNETLSELQIYSKRNYTAEESKTFDVEEVLQKLYETLAPDCEANNITLRYIGIKTTAFGRKNDLISVINNLIFNAIEHAECSEIVLSLSKRKGICKICVTDNGKGIQNKEEIFQPYYTKGNTETENEETKKLTAEGRVKDNLGLGLYISRQTILAMGGELILDQSSGKTVFAILIPAV